MSIECFYEDSTGLYYYYYTGKLEVKSGGERQTNSSSTHTSNVDSKLAKEVFKVPAFGTVYNDSSSTNARKVNEISSRHREFMKYITHAFYLSLYHSHAYY